MILYMLFAYPHYYPVGGARDLLASFAARHDAIAIEEARHRLQQAAIDAEAGGQIFSADSAHLIRVAGTTVTPIAGWDINRVRDGKVVAIRPSDYEIKEMEAA